jgi:hypothetical protein
VERQPVRSRGCLGSPNLFEAQELVFGLIGRADFPREPCSSHAYVRGSAIDKQLDTGDETGIPGGQKKRHGRDLSRLPDASHRDDRDKLILDLVWNAGEYAGVDGAGQITFTRRKSEWPPCSNVGRSFNVSHSIISRL